MTALQRALLSSPSMVAKAWRSEEGGDQSDRRDIFPLPRASAAQLPASLPATNASLLLAAVNFAIAGLNCLNLGGSLAAFGALRGSGPSAGQRRALDHVIERVLAMHDGSSAWPPFPKPMRRWTASSLGLLTRRLLWWRLRLTCLRSLVAAAPCVSSGRRSSLFWSPPISSSPMAPLASASTEFLAERDLSTSESSRECSLSARSGFLVRLAASALFSWSGSRSRDTYDRFGTAASSRTTARALLHPEGWAILLLSSTSSYAEEKRSTCRSATPHLSSTC